MLQILPHELDPPPGSTQARQRILAAGEAYQAAHVTPKVLQRTEAARSSLKAALAAALAKGMEQMTKRVPPKARSPGARARRIIEEVAIKHQMGAEDICCPSRKAQIVLARQEACYRIAAEVTSLSYVSISKIIGIQHTSVMYALRRYGKANGLPVKLRVCARPAATMCADVA